MVNDIMSQQLAVVLLLHMQAVQDDGGFECVGKEKKWPKIAVRLCYQASKNIGSTLRLHYEKTLHPYDVFMAGTTTDDEVAVVKCTY